MWLEKGLAEAYFNVAEEYKDTVFKRGELAKSLGTNLNHTDWIVHELRKNLALERVEWGKYKIVSPEKWIGIAKVTYEYPQMQAVLKEIFSRVSPEKIDTLVLYGSVARGESTKNSDLDMMMVTNLKDRPHIDKALKNLPGKVNVQVYSWKGIRGVAEIDPLFLVFTEAEAEVIFDVDKDYDKAVSLAVSDIVNKPKKVFNAHLKDIVSTVGTAKKLIEKRKKPQLAAYFLVYSVRNLFMMRQALNDKINPYGIGAGLKGIFGDSYDNIYGAYRLEREDEIGKEQPKIKMLRQAFIKVNELLEEVAKEVKEHEPKKAASKGR